jgi:hypothetical protein
MRVGEARAEGVSVGGGVEVQETVGVADGDDKVAVEEREGGATQEQRLGLLSVGVEQDRLRAEIDVGAGEAVGGLLSFGAGVGEQLRFEVALEAGRVGRFASLACDRLPLALDEAAVGGPRVRGLRRDAALDVTLHQRALDETLQRAAITADEAVEEFGLLARQHLRAPARDQLLQCFCGVHRVASACSGWCRRRQGAQPQVEPLQPPLADPGHCSYFPAGATCPAASHFAPSALRSAPPAAWIS